MDAATQVRQQDERQTVEGGARYVEMLWGKIKHETTWARFVRIRITTTLRSSRTKTICGISQAEPPATHQHCSSARWTANRARISQARVEPVPVSVRQNADRCGVAEAAPRQEDRARYFSGAHEHRCAARSVQQWPQSTSTAVKALIVGALLLPKATTSSGASQAALALALHHHAGGHE
jgi:hypothetical protein